MDGYLALILKLKCSPSLFKRIATVCLFSKSVCLLFISSSHRKTTCFYLLCYRKDGDLHKDYFRLLHASCRSCPTKRLHNDHSWNATSGTQAVKQWMIGKKFRMSQIPCLPLGPWHQLTYFSKANHSERSSVQCWCFLDQTYEFKLSFSSSMSSVVLRYSKTEKPRVNVKQRRNPWLQRDCPVTNGAYWSWDPSGQICVCMCKKVTQTAGKSMV